MTKTLPDLPREPRIYRRPGIATRDIDPDALATIHRIAESGAPALFVGGCVRDLLLGRKPKDFDVVTPISLRRVRRIFRNNSRVIGRRHRLVHVFYPGGKVIEISTYPRPDEDSDVLAEDAEILDAYRRDFTINALYYDPIEDELIDFVEGFEDIQRRVLRSIGPARENFLEDPVRIVRGVRYSSLLEFEIDETTFGAMKELAWTVSLANKRRMQEELWKFLLAPRTEPSFRLFAELGIFSILFPELRGFLDPESPSRFWEYLRLKDEIPTAELTHTFATTILFLPFLDSIVDLGEGEVVAEEERIESKVGEVVESIGRTYSLARKIRYGVVTLLLAQLRFVRGPGGRRRRILQSLLFDQAFRLFRLFCQVHPRFSDAIPAWEVEARRRPLRREEEGWPAEGEEGAEGSAGEPRRRRRRRRRRG